MLLEVKGGLTGTFCLHACRIWTTIGTNGFCKM